MEAGVWRSPAARPVISDDTDTTGCNEMDGLDGVDGTNDRASVDREDLDYLDDLDDPDYPDDLEALIDGVDMEPPNGWRTGSGRGVADATTARSFGWSRARADSGPWRYHGSRLAPVDRPHAWSRLRSGWRARTAILPTGHLAIRCLHLGGTRSARNGSLHCIRRSLPFRL
jgi:hypothetical protein